MWWGGDGQGWTDEDRVLTMALTLYEDGLCGECGQPRHLAHNPDADGWYASHVVVCAACQATQSAAKNQKEHVPGLKRYAVSILPEGRQLAGWDGRGVPEEGTPTLGDRD